MRRVLHLILDIRPWALACACLLLIIIIAQFPQPYAFKPGIERGPASDLPFLSSFYAPEGKWPDGMFRWSRTEFASVQVPAQGRRGIILDFTILAHRAQRFPEAGPTMLRLQTNYQGASPEFALRQEGARYLVYLPPEALPMGELDIRFATASWQNPGDSRDELGVALARQLRIRPTLSTGLVAPDIVLAYSMPLAVLLVWATVRMIGFEAFQALRLLTPVALGLPFLLLIDYGRMGFVGRWLPVFGLIASGAALVCAQLVARLFQKLDHRPAPMILRWLVLIMVLTFALKYAGRWFPDAMPGDWQLHVNRFNASVRGDLMIQAQHRGLPFPFPTGYYLVIAPLILSGVNVATLLPILAAVWETISVLVIYLLVVKAIPSARLGLLAAAIYAFTAAGYMNTWFSFHTQISTQMFTALLMLTLVWAWPHYTKPGVWWLLLMLLSQMFLGHIGTFINAGLLGLIIVIWLFIRGRESGGRDQATEGAAQSFMPLYQQNQRSTVALALVGIVATLFALICFYTLFAGLIIEQISGVASSGLVAVSGKKPLAADVYLRSLWYDGLITHYGFFPVLLAIPGALALRRRLPHSMLPRLVWATFGVSLALGLLPLFTQSAIMTRWLTFAAWAVAVAGAMGLTLFWRRGRAARVASAAMAAYVLWITALVWIEALTQRLPPVEPF